MKVYVILGRFGDIFMVCKKLKEPSIICCSKAFSKIAKELFPIHTVFEVSNYYGHKPLEAVKVYKKKFPSKEIILCQQFGQDRDLMKDFKSFQSFHEYYASI